VDDTKYREFDGASKGGSVASESNLIHHKKGEGLSRSMLTKYH